MAARMQDVRDVGTRVARHEIEPTEFKIAPKGSVIVAAEITPADTALMDPSDVAGFATDMGGVEGHTAIMARSLELPAVLEFPTSRSSGPATLSSSTARRAVW